MQPFSFLYRFTSGQRKGIVALFAVILIVQAAYFILNSFDFSGPQQKSIEEKEWLAHQGEIDALKAKTKDTSKTIHPFNPNFISDYKGYTLGMTPQQIDRLQAYRKQNKWVNSAEDFKKVTGVSDSLLATISPYFKFPDWVKNKQPSATTPHTASAEAKKEILTAKEVKVIPLDINTALEEDLVKIYGIGPAFAKTLLRRRARLGAFVSMDQMNEFTAFSPEAVAGLKKQFRVVSTAGIATINVNTASLQQLSRFPYFNRDIAKSIITQRSMNGKIIKIDELSKINDFPVESIKIIALYLEF
jgi:DNA uptake protein ComE-like DNA-binding protein